MSYQRLPAVWCTVNCRCCSSPSHITFWHCRSGCTSKDAAINLLHCLHGMHCQGRFAEALLLPAQNACMCIAVSAVCATCDVIAPICLQVALTAVKDAMGAVSYVEFVLHPASMFESFVSVADKVLEAIQPAGGAQVSEPRQQVRHSKRAHDFGHHKCTQQLSSLCGAQRCGCRWYLSRVVSMPTEVSAVHVVSRGASCMLVRTM